MKDMRPVDATTKWLSVLALAIGLAVAGCGIGPAPSVAVQSPPDTAYSFLQAMGNGDQARMNTYLVPSRRNTDSQGDPPPADEFRNLRCSLVADHAGTDTAVVVACDFDVREDWSGFSAGHCAWTVSLQRQPPGPWLIDNWGAG